VEDRESNHPSLLSKQGNRTHIQVALMNHTPVIAFLTHILRGGRMKPDHMFHTIKGLSVVGLTSLSMFCLSSQTGATGIALGIVFLYIAFFTSLAFHRSEQ
jgi:hypothetical protein